VDFTLTYDGPLPAKASPTKKHEIRRQLHPQLLDLRSDPVVKNVDKVPPVKVGDYTFTSIVHPFFSFRTKLDILMLKPETSGKIITGGDIDNRLKTLFDALTRPRHAQDIPRNWVPGPNEQPLHCLLDDDALISSVTVRTDRLLAPATPTHVKLIIGVSVRTTRFFGGIALYF
jgi:hypothetical protein